MTERHTFYLYITIRSLTKNQSLVGRSYQNRQAFWFLKKKGIPNKGMTRRKMARSLYQSNFRAEEITGGCEIIITFFPFFRLTFFSFRESTISSPAKWVSGNPPQSKNNSARQKIKLPANNLNFLDIQFQALGRNRPANQREGYASKTN